jgi:hypothetical protein
MSRISTVGVLRLRATSAVSRDKSVRRSAQDDGFVGVLTKNILNKLALMELRPGLSSVVPVRQAQGRLCGTQFAVPVTARPPRNVCSESILGIAEVSFVTTKPERRS